MTQKIIRAISQQPEPSSDNFRPVFATYLNMARVNLYNVLRYISVQCGLKANTEEDHLYDMPVVHFADNKKPEVQEKVKTLLFRHLPFLQQMAQAYVKKASSTENKEIPNVPKATDVQFLLQHIIEIINFNRNYYTHDDHYDTISEIQKEIRLEAELISPFNKCFTGSKRECKRIFMYSNKDMHFVDGNDRMVNTGQKDDEGHPIYKEKKDYYFRLNNADDQRLTTAGLVFLTCKLIHKRYATQFVQKIGLFRIPAQRGFSPFKEEENKIMFDIYCAHRIRLPKGRVESTANSTALGLDMLNELQKCPVELFETFSPADRQLFQVNRKNNNTEPDDDINLFRRYGDRFTQLALKFIDSFNSVTENRSKGPLPNIVFQVALGKYRHTFYNRTSLDDEERLRVIQKEINGFGPITKIEELRKDENHYKNIIRAVSDNQNQLYDADTAQTLPYITDHRASYAITGGRIGLMWNVDKDDKPLDDQTLCFLPTLPEPIPIDKNTSDNNNDFKTNRKNGKITNNLIPRAWLSIHDLPALIFLYMLGGNPGKIIKDYYITITKLLSKIESGDFKPLITGQLKPEGKKRDKQIRDYREGLEKKLNDECGGIKLSDLPEKLIEYLLYGKITKEQEAESNFKKWVERKLDGDENTIGMIQSLTNRIEKFKSDLKTVGSKQNRIGRKAFVDIRPGTLARYIAKDIMAMTTADPSLKNNDKPSGLDFAVLQSAIASYISYDSKLLRDTPLGQLLGKAINIDKHPFLNIVMKQKVYDTLDLYQKYLESKRDYLNTIRSKGYNKDRDWFLREAYRNHVAKTENYVKGADGLAARYRMTLQLPNRLFTKDIRERLAALHNPEIDKALKDEKKTNGISHLIYAYFKNHLNDDSQPFYRDEDGRFKRHYKLLDVLFHDGTETYLTDTDITVKLKKESENVQSPAIKEIKKIKGQNEEDYRKKMHQLHELQRNERDIRRHRNNDILLFLMAKQLLTDSAIFNKNEAKSVGIEQFKLKDILPPAYTTNKNTSILEQPITFALTFSLADEKGKPIMDHGVPMKRTVYQEGIKLKNYGDFYAFLYDTRIGSLLSQLPHQEPIKREDLEKELDFYDRRRHEVFALLQAIERKIIRENPSVQDNNAEGEGFYYNKRVGNTIEPIAYRNNFYGLLTLCNKYLISIENTTEPELSKEAKMLVEIRNAFSHNRYVKSLTAPIDISKLSLPDVAKMIIEWLEKNK